MKKRLLLILLLCVANSAIVLAQSRSSARNSASRNRAPADGARGPQGRLNDDGQPEVFVGKIKLNKPVIVYYEQAAPGKAVQQLIMAEENLGLLKTLDLEELINRREVFVDGLSNRPLPGSDQTKYRLLGTSAVAEDTRRPAGDGRSFYSRLKVPASGVLYVVRESAEEYRHFVKGPQKKGSFLDFQINGLPGIDSVRAVYTLRKMDSAEQGTGATIR
ncbi:hypothetical protein [Hymenobacter arizonensis]|uniref:Uncharacterized protein n=1 Tax=Hymenobacter arizonensis TaxID=1227077 RepID=A0A1I5UQA1_HYMAR|nr:hypothetical protein [Hymenobacter arizonensis]SFP97463.1 hypothetical protein SAMN04515668_1029 [Hymenobacter arizonensis]